jgi:hypothetical protein
VLVAQLAQVLLPTAQYAELRSGSYHTAVVLQLPALLHLQLYLQQLYIQEHAAVSVRHYEL